MSIRNELRKLLDNNNIDTIKSLIEAGLNIETPLYECGDGEYTCTPLMYVSGRVNSDVEIAKLLIESGARINYQDSDNETPLMRAVYHGYNDMVKLLISHGAEIELTDSFDNTALVYAIIYQQKEIADLIKTRANEVKLISLVDEYSGHYSDTAITDLTKKLQKLLAIASGVNINVINEALMIAARKGWSIAVKILIEAGAYIDAQDSGGYTALMFAVLAGYQEVIQDLSAAGASPDLINIKGQTAYDIATSLDKKFYRNKEEIIEILQHLKEQYER